VAVLAAVATFGWQVRDRELGGCGSVPPMRFLVYGAGNIGSLYAARLAHSSQDVAILARGTRFEQIRRQGIELEDGVSGERTTMSLEVVAGLDPDDAYDVVLVILPK